MEYIFIPFVVLVLLIRGVAAWYYRRTYGRDELRNLWRRGARRRVKPSDFARSEDVRPTAESMGDKNVFARETGESRAMPFRADPFQNRTMHSATQPPEETAVPTSMGSMEGMEVPTSMGTPEGAATPIAMGSMEGMTEPTSLGMAEGMAVPFPDAGSLGTAPAMAEGYGLYAQELVPDMPEGPPAQAQTRPEALFAQSGAQAPASPLLDIAGLSVADLRRAVVLREILGPPGGRTRRMGRLRR